MHHDVFGIVATMLGRNVIGKGRKIMNIRNWMIVIAASAMGACASEPSAPPPGLTEHDQMILDFAVARELEEVARIRGAERRSFEKISPSYILFKPRRGEFLVEFSRPCWEIWHNTYISADDTYEHSTLRANYDRMRGCRLNRIFALTKEDVIDLEQLGLPPRN